MTDINNKSIRTSLNFQPNLIGLGTYIGRIHNYIIYNGGYFDNLFKIGVSGFLMSIHAKEFYKSYILMNNNHPSVVCNIIMSSIFHYIMFNCEIWILEKYLKNKNYFNSLIMCMGVIVYITS